ncbi:MAG: nickel pincer cofactor biosynthesis protein LarC [Bacteroidales bacterium]|jgi:uncharacterized protein (TIGR00299 family) protein|nr:nickel pincer cofactor biosynthesis protein LarC [Bacteroidales bacterium]
MKILYYDCFAGISGDMNLGALIDLGVDAGYLAGELRKLNLEGYEIRVSGQQRKGITGTQVDVILTGNGHEHGHDHDHSHGDGDHGHSHGHHHHHGPPSIFEGLKRRILPEYYRELEHEHEHKHEHSGHRNLGDIGKIILESDLSDRVKTMSMDIFRIVARAEAKIHGKPLEEVHFHEVGAVDSIVDIVGAAICIDYLAPDRIIASPVEMGGGFVNCAHGVFPVPAPATLEIMKGNPMKLGAVPFETATPTGVAILAALVDEFTETPAFTIVKTGYGIGHRDTEIPNVLRVCIGETGEAHPDNRVGQATGKTVDAVVMECNIDDMNPERYAYVMERLFEAGADDVYLQNIMMKKSRPAVMLSVLCDPGKIPAVEHLLFTETSTLGVRCKCVRKTMLDRRTATIDTPWGPVRIKEAYYQGKKLKTKPEYDDCAAIARKHGISIEKAYLYINRQISAGAQES